MNALDVAGAGKIAKAGLKGLGKLGLDYMPELAGNLASTAAVDLADPMMIEWLSGWEKYSDGVTLVAKRSYVGKLATASLLQSGVSAAMGVHANSVNSPNPSGYYEITYKDGTKYHGVGPESRMKTSANKYATTDNPVIEGGMKYTPTNNRADAYILEQKGINRDGLMKGGKTFNKINSPGKKLMKLFFK